MSPGLLHVLCLLLCMVATGVFSRKDGGEDSLLDDVSRQCAVALNQSLNTSSSEYLSLSKSLCNNEDYDDGVCDEDVVWIKSDRVSHTNANSTIRVQFNPNSTIFQDEFNYVFCVDYNSTSGMRKNYELIACVTNEGEELEIKHSWRSNGQAKVRVGVYYSRDLVACNSTTTTVAGNFGVKIGANVNQSNSSVIPVNGRPSTSSTSSTPSSSHSYFSTNSTNNTYITGNLTFHLHTEVTINSTGPEVEYSYTFFYNYGDNSPLEEKSNRVSTHLYNKAGNYSYAIEGYVINVNHPTKAYYGLHRGLVIVMDPISNASVMFNNNNSVIANTKVYLHTCVNGTFPIALCWTIHQLNSSTNPTPLSSSFSSLCSSSSSFSSMVPGECHTIYQWNPCPSFEITTPDDKGRYEIIAVFNNPVSCVTINYTFHVVDASKPPIVATTTSVGVVFAIVLAVLVVLILLAVGGYLPYKRYRNRMIETADFKFIDLSGRKLSKWKKFKLKVKRLFRSRRNTDKIGLVNLIDEQNRASGSNNRSKSMSSSSSSSSSSGSSCNNYNTV